MNLLYILYVWLKSLIRKVLVWFYDLYSLAQIPNIRKQIFQIPIHLRNRNGKIVLKGRNNFGKGITILIQKQGVLSLSGDVKIDNQCQIITTGHLAIERGVVISEKVKLHIANTDFFLQQGSSIGPEAQLIVNNPCRLGSYFTLGRCTVLVINSNWNIGSHVTISSDCIVAPREAGKTGRLTMGDGAQIGPNTLIDLCHDLEIAEGAIVGPNCVIYTHNHDYKQSYGKALGKADVITAPVYIGRYSWIGTNVVILPGVTIGENVVVAAGSVVTKSIPANCLAGGVPAKVIKELNLKFLV